MSLTVVGQRVLVRPDPLQTEVTSIKGFEIVRPVELERAERAATGSGIVLQLGNIAFQDIGKGEAWCSVGDHIIYARHAGKIIKEPDTEEELFIIRDEDVQAIIKKAD